MTIKEQAETVTCPFCSSAPNVACINVKGWATSNTDNHVHASRISALRAFAPKAAEKEHSDGLQILQ